MPEPEGAAFLVSGPQHPKPFVHMVEQVTNTGSDVAEVVTAGVHAFLHGYLP